jgi:methionyl aminopeptidase
MVILLTKTMLSKEDFDAWGWRVPFWVSILMVAVSYLIRKKMHESPEVPNFGNRGQGKVIKNGLVIAIEPMINMGTARVMKTSDNWTIVTADGKPSAHFEHNVAVIDGKPEILSTFQYVEEALARKAAL